MANIVERGVKAINTILNVSVFLSLLSTSVCLYQANDRRDEK